MQCMALRSGRPVLLKVAAVCFKTVIYRHNSSGITGVSTGFSTSTDENSADFGPQGPRVKLAPADWAIIAAYFFFNIGIGLYYKSRAGAKMSEFFLSGRNVPWWLAGTSMVATTFAADTSLVVTGLVARNGIAGNWLW